MSRLEVVRETLRLALGAMDRVGAAPDWDDWGVVKERYRSAPSDWRHVSRDELRRRFEWGAACDACPLRGSCTTSKSGRRTVCVGAHHDRLQARRREMKTEAFRKRMHQRNAIEGTISELTRLGLRRTRYRGLAKTTLANHVLAAACNVRRWLRLLAWRQQNAPALAPA